MVPPSQASKKKAESDPIEDLVTRAQAGDESVLPALIQATQSRLFQFCLRLTGNASTAEELAQDTYLKALARLQDFERRSSFPTWLFKIARNLFVDQTRTAEHKLEKSETHSTEENDVLGRLPDASRADVDHLMAVQAALNSLSKDERVVLLLVDYEEYSYAEAAEIVGISENALRSRVHRARKAFHEKFRGSE